MSEEKLQRAYLLFHFAIWNTVGRKKRSHIYGFADKENSFLLVIKPFPPNNAWSSVANWKFTYLKGRRDFGTCDRSVLDNATCILTVMTVRNKAICENAHKNSHLNNFPICKCLEERTKDKVVVVTEKYLSLSQQVFVWVSVLLMWETEKSVKKYFVLSASRNMFHSCKFKFLINKIYTCGSSKHNLFFSHVHSLVLLKCPDFG